MHFDADVFEACFDHPRLQLLADVERAAIDRAGLFKDCETTKNLLAAITSVRVNIQLKKRRVVLEAVVVTPAPNRGYPVSLEDFL